MHWGMGLGWILGVVLLILIVWIVTKTAHSNTLTFSERQKTALEILKERFAKGEIDKEEYEEKRRILLQ